MKKYGLSGQNKTVKLNKLHVSGNVCGEYIEYTIQQSYTNTSQEDMHCIYTFPVPESAVLSGLTVTLGGKHLEAFVESRETVLAQLKEARDAGVNPISMESDGEEDVAITIGDVMPGETVGIKISYMDQLITDDNINRLIIPSVVDPTLLNSETEEEEKGSQVNFYLSLLIESYGEVEVTSPSHKILVEPFDETLRKVTIVQGQSLTRDFVLDIIETKPREADGIAYTYYDQQEELEKSILMMRFFPILPQSGNDGPKDYTFIMDLAGPKDEGQMEEAKNALLIALRNLDAGDSFNIIAFTGQAVRFNENDKVKFNRENLEKATDWIENLDLKAGGDTFEVFRQVLAEAEGSDQPEYIFFFSDEQVDNEDEIIDYVASHIGEARLFPIGMDFAVNSYFIEQLARVGYGMAEYVEEGQRLDDIILRQFHRIHNPQLDVREIDWGTMEVTKTYPGTLSYLYDREPMTMFASVNGAIEGQVRLKGTINGVDGEIPYEMVADLDKLEIEENSKLIEKVWARKIIESLEERSHKARGTAKEALKERILEISREYDMISEETAYTLREILEDQVTGFAVSHPVPLDMTEETMRQLSESFFLDDTRYSKDYTLRSTMASKGMTRTEALQAIPFERENLLRILAKNQQADGSFQDVHSISQEEVLEVTLKALLAFTIGKEPATIYLNNINKSFSYLMQAIKENDGLLTERNLMLLSIAYELADDKRLIKGKTKEALDQLFDRIEEGMYSNSLKEVETVVANTSPLQMKYIMAAALNISSSQNTDLGEIFARDIKSNIGHIAEVALVKAL